MEDPGTFGAAGAHSLDLPTDTQPALAPTTIPEEPQGFRRYQTRMGPRAPSPVPQRRRRRARPSKWARTSGHGKSSRSRPEPSPPPTDEGSSSQLSLASRIRSPLGVALSCYMVVWISVEKFLYKGNVGFLGEMLLKNFKTHVFVLAITWLSLIQIE